MNIESNKQLKIEQALYFKKKLHPQVMKVEIENITRFLKENGLSKNGFIASASLGAEQTSSEY